MYRILSFFESRCCFAQMKIFGRIVYNCQKMSKVSESRDVEMQSMSESKGSASDLKKSVMHEYDLPRQCVAEFVGTSMVRKRSFLISRLNNITFDLICLSVFS